MHQQNQLTANSVLILMICDMGNHHFKQHLSLRKDIEDRIVLALLAAVRVDRESNSPRFSFQEAQLNNGGTAATVSAAATVNAAGGIVDYGVLRSCCRMLQCLGLYETKFEPCLVQESMSFFALESQDLLSTDHAGEGSSVALTGVPSAAPGAMSAAAAQYYLYHVDFRMAQVGAMVSRYLVFECSRYSLIRVIENSLLAPIHTSLVIDSGLSALLTAHAVSDVSKLYNLLSRLGGSTAAGSSGGGIVQALCGQWGAYIR